MRRTCLALLAVLGSACRGKPAPAPATEAADLDTVARTVVGEIAKQEAARDVTCWTSFRQIDWFIATRPYTEFATLAKIGAVKSLVREVWARASARAQGATVTAADVTAAAQIPDTRLDPAPAAPAAADGGLPVAQDLGLQNYQDYTKTSEHWRVVLAVTQDEMRRPAGGLKPLAPEAAARLAEAAARVSILLVRRSGELAEEARALVVDGPQVQQAYKEVAGKLGLAPSTRPGRPLVAADIQKRLAPVTRELIEAKVKALHVFNKAAADLTTDLNRVSRMTLSKEAVERIVRDAQSFAHFITAGFEPMQADNYVSDGNFAASKLPRLAYLDETHVANAVMQLFPHEMLPDSDIVVRFEPNPGPVTRGGREPYEIRMRGDEMDGVRDSAVHWIVLRNVWNEKPFAIDPFAAEYLSEVISMLVTLEIRQAEAMAKRMGKTQIDAEVAAKVRDPDYVMVPPRTEASASWGPAAEARKKELLAGYRLPLFNDVTARSGLPATLWSDQGGGKDLAGTKGHLEGTPGHLGGTPGHYGGTPGHYGGAPEDGGIAGHVGGTPGHYGGTPGHFEGQPSLGHFNIQKVMGGGMAVGDVDGDGYPDLFLAGERLGRLYLNGGKAAPGRFRDVTEAWGIPRGLDDSHGAVLADLDGDGDLDLLVICGDHPSVVLMQDRKRFTDVAAKVGLVTHRGAHVASVFDADRDGDLDVFVGYYGSDAANTTPGVRNLPSLDGKNGSASQLWRREDDGRYSEVAGKVGLADTGWVLAATTLDYNRDGLLDLFLATDFGADALYRGRADGTFEDVRARTQVNDRGSGMNASVTDVNGDGWWDIYVTNIDMFNKRIKVIFPRDDSTISLDEPLVRGFQYIAGNKLHVNPADPAGDKAFPAEQLVRFEPGDRGWGWDANFLDYDNDGDEDMYLSNGWLDGSYAANQKNELFLNDGGRFYLAPGESPEAFAGNSRSVVSADLDRDGDLDLVVNNFRQPPRMFENAQKSGNHWLGLRLVGKGKNTRAIGALVTVDAGGKKMMRQRTGGRGYLSEDDEVVMVGLGAEKSADVTVRWPGGAEQKVAGVAADGIREIRE